MVVSCIQLDEDILTVATWAIVAPRSMWPFHFFTNIFVADVIAQKVDWSITPCLAASFTAPINSAGSMFV
jgi:hypothetical protein